MREYQLIHGQTVDDAHLVAAAQEGHEWAFARLFERHSARLWPYACALSGGEIDGAQDLLQETFVRAYSRLGELRSGTAFHAWLRTLVYRLALDGAITAFAEKVDELVIPDRFRPDSL